MLLFYTCSYVCLSLGRLGCTVHYVRVNWTYIHKSVHLLTHICSLRDTSSTEKELEETFLCAHRDSTGLLQDHRRGGAHQSHFRGRNHFSEASHRVSVITEHTQFTAAPQEVVCVCLVRWLCGFENISYVCGTSIVLVIFNVHMLLVSVSVPYWFHMNP